MSEKVIHENNSFGYKTSHLRLGDQCLSKHTETDMLVAGVNVTKIHTHTLQNKPETGMWSLHQGSTPGTLHSVTVISPIETAQGTLPTLEWQGVS